jgi:hypothetical protein
MPQRVDEVWAYRRYVRDRYLAAGAPAESVQVIPLAIDPDVVRPGLEPLPLPEGPKTPFLFVRGTSSCKGIHVLPAAFERAFKARDYAGDDTASLIQARRGEFAECPGDVEAIARVNAGSFGPVPQA